MPCWLLGGLLALFAVFTLAFCIFLVFFLLSSLLYMFCWLFYLLDTKINILLLFLPFLCFQLCSIAQCCSKQAFWLPCFSSLLPFFNIYIAFKRSFLPFLAFLFLKAIFYALLALRWLATIAYLLGWVLFSFASFNHIK